MEHIWQSIVDIATNWSKSPLAVGITVGIIGPLLTLFRNHISQLFSFLSKWLWAFITRRGKDYAFERAYLKWIINQHHSLGLLPGRIVAARWGDEGRTVDLEKVYISLQISAQGGEKNSAETAPSDSSSWRRQPRLYTMLRKNLSFGILFSIPLITLSIFIILTILFSHLLIIYLTIIIALAILCTFLVLIKWRASRREEPYQPGDLALAIDSHKQLVIRGDPGSGKTTHS